MYISDEIFNSAPPAEGRADRENRVYKFLDEKGIPYMGFDHDSADTMEICEMLESRLGAKICKNLFLCNRQETEFYLLMMPGDKPFKTKFLSQQIGSARLSFASPENMLAKLDILPGSVSVFGLMNNKEHDVHLLLDAELKENEFIGCHPCVCTSVLKLSTADLLGRILPELGFEPQFVELPRSFD